MKRPKLLFFSGVAVGIGLVLIVTAILVFGMTKTDTGYRWLVQRASAKLRAPVFPQTPAEYDWQAADLITGELASAQQLQGRTVFLTFWHPHCPYCVATMPYIQNLYEKAKDENVVFWCVAEKDPTEDLGEFTQEVLAQKENQGLTMPILIADGPRPQAFKSRGTPVTFILGPDNKIAFRYESGARWDDEACLRFLQQLSAGASPTAVESAVPPA
jgi:thiol-disulfide isomerase/thioredoxin